MIINDMPGGGSLDAAGSATQPIYINSNGEAAATTYALNKTVPSDAKFTDTTYSAATTSAAGLMSAADKTKLNGIATGATKVTTSTVSGWGYTKNAGTVTSVSGTGVLSGTVTSSGSITHSTSGVTAGSYGSSSAVPVITVNDTGHITGVSTEAISGGITITLLGSWSTSSSSSRVDEQTITYTSKPDFLCWYFEYEYNIKRYYSNWNFTNFSDKTDTSYVSFPYGQFDYSSMSYQDDGEGCWHGTIALYNISDTQANFGVYYSRDINSSARPASFVMYGIWL